MPFDSGRCVSPGHRRVCTAPACKLSSASARPLVRPPTFVSRADHPVCLPVNTRPSDWLLTCLLHIPFVHPSLPVHTMPFDSDSWYWPAHGPPARPPVRQLSLLPAEPLVGPRVHHLPARQHAAGCTCPPRLHTSPTCQKFFGVCTQPQHARCIPVCSPSRPPALLPSALSPPTLLFYLAGWLPACLLECLGGGGRRRLKPSHATA